MAGLGGAPAIDYNQLAVAAIALEILGPAGPMREILRCFLSAACGALLPRSFREWQTAQLASYHAGSSASPILGAPTAHTHNSRLPTGQAATVVALTVHAVRCDVEL
jgi:hypothetical protein